VVVIGSAGLFQIIGKSSQLQEKAVLDGATPPVNTIIFENTNFKSAPVLEIQDRTNLDLNWKKALTVR
jgi:hypothetical protein